MLTGKCVPQLVTRWEHCRSPAETCSFEAQHLLFDPEKGKEREAGREEEGGGRKGGRGREGGKQREVPLLLQNSNSA